MSSISTNQLPGYFEYCNHFENKASITPQRGRFSIIMKEDCNFQYTENLSRLMDSFHHIMHIEDGNIIIKALSDEPEIDFNHIDTSLEKLMGDSSKIEHMYTINQIKITEVRKASCDSDILNYMINKNIKIIFKHEYSQENDEKLSKNYFEIHEPIAVIGKPSLKNVDMSKKIKFSTRKKIGATAMKRVHSKNKSLPLNIQIRKLLGL